MLGFWGKQKAEVMLENMFCIFLLVFRWWCLLVRKVERRKKSCVLRYVVLVVLL